MVSYSHLICAKGIYVAIISTTVETENPEAEIEPAVSSLETSLKCSSQCLPYTSQLPRE